MELNYLLNEEKATRRTYRHFTINNTSTPEALVVKKLEFFYIGKKSENIDILIRSFESGYAAENISNAKAMLTRLTGSKDRHVAVPDVIIVDTSVDSESLRELSRFLSSSKVLATIPFVAEASGAHTADIARFKNCTFIDEIIFLKDYNKATLHRKVSFLKKVKERQVNELAVSNETKPNTRKVSGVFFKRAFDITVSSAILLAASPVMLLIALAVKLESRGPVFYIAKRAGRGYRIFDFYKFRTMQVNADSKIKDFSHLNQYNANQTSGPVFFKINNDPRITKIGNFLRNTSLDELPQLLNVLKGDMSLVGNRPLPLYEAATLTTDEWAKRFMAPAGMTGLWQIKKRGKDDMSVEERLTLDIDYADKYSFLYDLWIMANTPSAILQKTNA
ncbi:MAG: sugar transferase [Chitinophagaceae bacterium]